ncbi:polysaccharide lyase 8 family protein [Bulleidia sp. zg-1006]|uniref:polysaccharide lyase 8 family protein n=1 Tax=Bulleidia sp. zg-1006 TaxID=2806552 RepID=UPI0019393EED|nr:polysaccharide lyase 8 family protein [Bulleidia sp. zg-1006]QRG86690.1 polysaccharide lyase 8 family protein [Bulleidia sp. zg-1006]
MKIKIIQQMVVKTIVLTLSLFLVITGFPMVQAQNPSASLVQNGDFQETIAKNGQWTNVAAKAWSVWVDKNKTKKNSYTIEAKNGQLQLAAKDTLRAIVHQTIEKKIDSSKQYRLSYRVHTKNKIGFFYARIQERKKSETKFTTSKALQTSNVYKNQAWKEITFDYKPSSEVDSVKLELIYETGTGEVFVDDVKLEEVAPSPKEIIKNSKFQETEDGKAPWTNKAAKHWTAWTPNEYKNMNGAKMFVNDKNELTISSQKEFRSCVYQDIPNFDNTKNYQLTVKAKLNQKQGIAKLRILEKRKDAKGRDEQVNSLSSNTLTGTTNGWQELKINYSPLSLTQFIRLELFYEKGKGTVQFKDVELKEIGVKKAFAPKEVNRILEKEITFPLDKIYTLRNPNYSYKALDDKINVQEGMIRANKVGVSKLEVQDKGKTIAIIKVHITNKVSDEYNRLLEQWNEMIVGNKSYDENNPAMKALFDTLETNAETYLKEMKQENNRTYLWEEAKEYERSSALTTSFRHLEAIAKQITNPKSKYYQSPKAIRQVREGMEWLCTNVYNKDARVIGNWWDYEIGTPRAINNTLSLLQQYFSQEEIRKYTDGIEHFVPDSTRFRVTQNDSFEAVGGNLIDMGRVKIIAGFLRKDDKEVKETVQAIQKVFVIVNKGQGFYQDGSYIDHTNVAYTGAYGNVLMDGFSQLLPIIQASKSPLPKEKLAVVRHWIEKAFLPLIVHNELMDMSRGRSISRSNSEDHVASVEVLRGVVRVLDVFDNAYKNSLRSEVKTILKEDTFYKVSDNLKSYGDIANVEKLLKDTSIPTLQRSTKLSLFNHMDKVAYYNAKKDFGFGISMHSNRTLNFEMMNNENRKAWYTADGMTYLYNGDLAHYSQNYWPTVDPYHLPGTTVFNSEKRPAKELGSTMSSSFVGAVKANESYGTVAMDFESQLKSISAHKAWFICDDQIVSMASAISKADSHTTVDQRKLEPKKKYQFFVNGKLVDLDHGKKEFQNVQSVFVESGDKKTNIGYHFLTPTNLELSKLEQSGKWSDIREVAGEDTSVHKNTFYRLVIPHKDMDNYAYSTIPSIQKDEFFKMIKNHPVRVIKNTKETQVIYDQRQENYGIVKYSDSPETFGVTKVSKKGIYSLVNGSGGYYQPSTMREERIENPTKQVLYKVLENDLEHLYRIRVNIPFAKFKAVFVDGVQLTKEQYLAGEGSTIIQLKKAYVNTLKTGQHTIRILAEDGQVSQSFYIQRKGNVKTADIYSWTHSIGLMVIGLFGLFLVIRYRKREVNA